MPHNLVRDLLPFRTHREWKLIYDALDGLHNAIATIEEGFDKNSVTAFGAVGDGVTDDAAAIQAAIDALPANGGLISFPPGIYRINSMLVLGNGTSSVPSTKNGIRLVGFGQSKVPGGAATSLSWGGAAAGQMIRIDGPIQGVEISHMNLLANSVANIALEAKSVRGSSFHDLAIHDYLQYGFLGHVTVGAAEGSFATSVRNIQLASLGTSATGIFLHGDPVGLIDWTESTFDTVLVFYLGNSTSQGVWLGFTDGNLFNNLHVVALQNDGGPVIHFDASIAPEDFPSGNTFVKPVLSVNGLKRSGSPGENTFFGYDELNGAAIPHGLGGISGFTRGNKAFGRYHLLCRATISSAQSIPDDTLTKVSFNAEDIDTHAIHSTVSNQTQLVIPFTGEYRITAGVTWASNSTGSRRVRVLVDDAPIPGLSEFKDSDAESSTSLASMLPLTEGDIVELEVFQNSGDALDLNAAALTVELIP